MQVGKLIVIEGNDGAGKATQVALLLERFKKENLKVATFEFPQYKKSLGGKLLAEVFKSVRANDYDFANLEPKIASILYAMDRMEIMPTVRQALFENDLVILDRYLSANVIHQGGKIKDDLEKMEYVEWLYDLEYNKLKNLKQDLTILLTLPFEISMTRTKARAESAGVTADALEQNLKYIKDSSAASVFFANQLDWTQVAAMDNERERSREEINDGLYAIIKKLLLN